MIGPLRSFGQACASAVPERRIYIRTDERTRYISLSARAQLAGSAIAVAALAWGAFTTVFFVDDALDGHAAKVRIETMREAYEARISALSDQQRSMERQLRQANLRRDAVTERLSDKQARLVEAANGLQEAQVELIALRDEIERMTGERRAEQARVEALTEEITMAREDLALAEISNENLTQAFASFGASVEQVIAERDEAASTVAALDGQVTALADDLDRLGDREERLVGQLEEAARISLAGLDKMFGRTAVDLESILNRARRDYSGAGGPFLPVMADGDGHDEPDESVTRVGDERVAALMKDLETVNLMRFAAERLPFGMPVEDGRFTSGFGPRRDPKGRGKSMHAGLDIAAPRGTAIYSTAAGVVTFAGRQRGYGIVVKIRHAFGFETVYAHLSRARVKVGQRVARGDRVADMGNTGRSTGTHLHYEIRIDKEPINPRKFIEAARDVL
jgi:murein DD-endopeptidase MepM/ murein hydrolase activator NlpD